MITAIVNIKLQNPVTLEDSREIFMGSASKYQGLPGLIRKYYLLSEDGMTAGGVYLWESREAAEELYTEQWYGFIVDKYGTAPDVSFFHSPVIVDNLSGIVS